MNRLPIILSPPKTLQDINQSTFATNWIKSIVNLIENSKDHKIYEELISTLSVSLLIERHCIIYTDACTLDLNSAITKTLNVVQSIDQIAKQVFSLSTKCIDLNPGPNDKPIASTTSLSSSIASAYENIPCTARRPSFGYTSLGRKNPNSTSQDGSVPLSEHDKQTECIDFQSRMLLHGRNAESYSSHAVNFSKTSKEDSDDRISKFYRSQSTGKQTARNIRISKSSLETADDNIVPDPSDSAKRSQVLANSTPFMMKRVANVIILTLQHDIDQTYGLKSNKRGLEDHLQETLLNILTNKNVSDGRAIYNLPKPFLLVVLVPSRLKSVNTRPFYDIPLWPQTLRHFAMSMQVITDMPVFSSNIPAKWVLKPSILTRLQSTCKQVYVHVQLRRYLKDVIVSLRTHLILRDTSYFIQASKDEYCTRVAPACIPSYIRSDIELVLRAICALYGVAFATPATIQWIIPKVVQTHVIGAGSSKAIDAITDSITRVRMPC